MLFKEETTFVIQMQRYAPFCLKRLIKQRIYLTICRFVGAFLKTMRYLCANKAYT